jgi:hypothetical protein
MRLTPFPSVVSTGDWSQSLISRSKSPFGDAAGDRLRQLRMRNGVEVSAQIGVGGDIAEVSLFTDGLERLALNFAEKRAFAPFLTSMSRAVSTQSPGRKRQLSQELRSFLESPAVTQRTDVDKTLIMARQC